MAGGKQIFRADSSQYQTVSTRDRRRAGLAWQQIPGSGLRFRKFRAPGKNIIRKKIPGRAGIFGSDREKNWPGPVSEPGLKIAGLRKRGLKTAGLQKPGLQNRPVPIPNLVQPDEVFNSESNGRYFDSLAPPDGEKKNIFTIFTKNVTSRHVRYFSNFLIQMKAFKEQ